MYFIRFCFIQILFLTTNSQEYNLQLGNELAVFRDCTVAIILQEVEHQNKSSLYNSYILEPLAFPFIHAKYRYAESTSSNGFLCGTKKMSPLPRQALHFFGTPSHKKLCFVMVLIEPKDCHNWRYSFNEKNPPSWNAFFDNTFFFIMNDFRNSPTTGATLKTGMYFIQVSKSINSLLQTESYDNTSAPIFELIDVIWRRESRTVVNFPTKLILVLYELPNNKIKVEKVHLSICVDYIGRYKKVVKKCGPSYNGTCLAEAGFFLGQPQKTIEINLTTTNIISKYLRNGNCFSFFYVGKSKFDTTKVAYLTRFMSGRFNIEPIAMQLILSNVTLINVRNGMIAEYTFLPAMLSSVETHPVGRVSLSLDKNKLHFITCSFIASKTTFLSLFGYISAFDKNSWLVIGICAAISVVVWRIAGKLSNVLGLGALFIYMILLGQSSKHVNKVKWLTGAWILTSIIISHSYQGENIERLTAPLSPKMIDEFSELLTTNVTIYSATGHKESRLRQGINRLVDQHTIGFFGSFYRYTIFGKVYLRKQINIPVVIAIKKMLQVLYTPKNKTEALNLLKAGFYLSRISTCEPVAYVGPLTMIQMLKRQLLEKGIPRKKIATSKTPYADVYDIWTFIHIPWEVVWFQNRILLLFQSGIPLLWKRWEFRISTWNETVQNEKNVSSVVRPISMDDNVAVVFYIHSGFLCLCILISLIELLQEKLHSKHTHTKVQEIEEEEEREGTSWCFRFNRKV
ncbi:unnamed protein product [Orchesella dallaii]|uniref:Uncharacterized protein n=1 Tax=Orchesella dallaii TaxID=48710 RepID=A0ABP1Q3F7_9HEXA